MDVSTISFSDKFKWTIFFFYNIIFWIVHIFKKKNFLNQKFFFPLVRGSVDAWTMLLCALSVYTHTRWIDTTDTRSTTTCTRNVIASVYIHSLAKHYVHENVIASLYVYATTHTHTHIYGRTVTPTAATHGTHNPDKAHARCLCTLACAITHVQP